jgi:hypothetical protein
MGNRGKRREWEIDIMKSIRDAGGGKAYANKVVTYALNGSGMTEAIVLADPLKQDVTTVNAHYMVDLGMVRIFSNSAGLSGSELWIAPLSDDKDYFLKWLPQYEEDGFRVVAADVVMSDGKGKRRTRDFDLIGMDYTLHRDKFVTEEERLIVDMVGKLVECGLPIVKKDESEFLFDGYLKWGESTADKPVNDACARTGRKICRNKFIIPISRQ